MADSIGSHPVISWLLTEGRGLVGSNEFLEAFALRLRKSGIEVTRVTTGVPILHPQIYSFSGRWQLGRGTSERLFRADRDDFRSLENSPIKVVYGGGGPVRCRPMTTATHPEFPIVEDLRQDGITDYVAFKVPFADGSHKALTLATTRRTGFTDSEIALFDTMIRPLRSILKSKHCGGRLGRSSTPTSAAKPAPGCSTGRSNAAWERRSMP